MRYGLSLSAVAIAAGYVAVAACVGDDPAAATGSGDAATVDGAGLDAAEGFGLKLEKARVVIAPGARVTFGVEVVRNGVGSAIQFGVAGVVPGVTVTGVAPEAPSVGSQAAQVTIDVAATATQQRIELEITGVAAGRSAVGRLTLVVPGTSGAVDTADFAVATGNLATVACGGDGDVRAVATTPEGKIVFAGRSCVVGLTSTGELDPTFGDGGLARFDGFDLVSLVALPTGQILTGGTRLASDGGVSRRPALARLDANGRRDPAFGASGLFVLDLPFDAKDALVTPLADGKLLVTATIAHPSSANDGRAVLLARLRPDLSYDPTFGTSSSGILDFALSTSSNTYVRAMAVRLASDGKIVIAGSEFNGGVPDWHGFVARATADGKIDTTFSDNGKQAVARVSSSYAFVYDLLLDNNLPTVIGQENYPNARRSIRTLANGAWASYLPADIVAAFYAATVDGNHRRIAVGSLFGAAVVERLNGLTLDPTFGRSGRADGPQRLEDGGLGGTVPPGFIDAQGRFRGITDGRAVTIDDLGRILVAGRNALGEMTVVRYWP